MVLVVQFLKQMYVLVLGLDVLGNPFGLIRGLSEGVEAFFYEPFQVTLAHTFTHINNVQMCQTFTSLWIGPTSYLLLVVGLSPSGMFTFPDDQLTFNPGNETFGGIIRTRHHLISLTSCRSRDHPRGWCRGL